MPQHLLHELLALDENTWRERGHALWESVDTWVDDQTSPDEQTKLDAVIAQSIAESEAGLGVPIEQAIAEVRAKRAARVRASGR